MSYQSATAFFDSWQTYRKVVAANYMHHAEIQADIERAIRARFATGQISLLDLGCGDAATIAPILQHMGVRRYKGVDLSEAALSHAAENLKNVSGEVELVHTDLLSALAADTARYDVIYSGFALHHLSTEQKGSFFKLAAERLADRSVLILVDVVRESDEDLPVYLDHYCNWMRKDWRGLDGMEIAAVCEHVANNDKPETFAELKALAAAAGFADAAGISAYGWHRVMRFQR